MLDPEAHGILEVSNLSSSQPHVNTIIQYNILLLFCSFGSFECEMNFAASLRFTAEAFCFDFKRKPLSSAETRIAISCGFESVSVLLSLIHRLLVWTLPFQFKFGFSSFVQ